MSSKILQWDELTVIREDVHRLFSRSVKPDKKERERFIGYLAYVLGVIYGYGVEDAKKVVGDAVLSRNSDDKAVNREIDGKTFGERIDEYIENGTEADVLRVIDTEAHRDYNTGVYDTAKASGKTVMKRWCTALDERVRDAHDYMEGQTVGLDDLFYTDTGESTMYPGGFGVPELDINCRCWIELTASGTEEK